MCFTWWGWGCGAVWCLGGAVRCSEVRGGVHTYGDMLQWCATVLYATPCYAEESGVGGEKAVVLVVRWVVG